MSLPPSSVHYKQPRRTLVPGAVFVAFVALGFPAHGALRYKVTDIFNAGVYVSIPYGLNARGQVVGEYIDRVNYNAHAFLHTPANGLIEVAGFFTCTAVNTEGTICGYGPPAGSQNRHALTYTSANGITDLGTLGGRESFATDVNDSGIVVGNSNTPLNTSLYHAFRHVPGSGMSDLGTLGGRNSHASAINSSGQIVGIAELSDNATYHAFLYTPGGGMIDLGTLGGIESHANEIDEAGHVVGQADTASGQAHAFFHDGTQMNDLGVIDGTTSAAHGINSAGWIVGQTDVDGGDTQHAFVYFDGRMHDLNDFCVFKTSTVLQKAVRINDAGQIICEGWFRNGIHGFLLTPEEVPPPGIKIRGKPLVTTRSARLVIKGSTTGDVTSVAFRVGKKGLYVPATGSASWKLNARLKPGRNIVTVLATGYGGQSTVTVTVTRRK